MKTKNYTFLLICLLMANLSFGQSTAIEGTISQSESRICKTFESGSFEGWQALATSMELATPAMDGSTYLRAHDRSGASYIYNNSYPSNWERYKGRCLCFDYKVFNDGVSNSVVNINPKIMLMNGVHPINSSIRAVFVANNTVTENDPWVHVCAPIEFSDGVNPPSNAQGQWTNVTAAEWDTLLSNIGTVAFFVDVAGSSAQTEIIGVDNICITECEDITVNDDGAYCCDGENLVKNGNFEEGAAGFTSDYTNDSSVYPGMFDVTYTAAAFGADIKDHSYCADQTLYANNKQFLLVNGKTQQSGNSVIWETTLSGLEVGESYKFCANFKNMPQCTFDILPNVNMEVSGVGSTGFNIISADASNPCDWISREYNFTATNSTVTLRIILDETGNGDGNDIAIDDIALLKLIDPELSITVQHQGNPQEITASINTISTSDDQLPGSDKCEYHWFVAAVDSYSPVVIDQNTFAHGNNGGNSVGSASWNLTTTFPDYNFNQNTMYIVGMYTPECDCYGEGFTYQLTFNNRPVTDDMMSEDQKQQIIDWILNGRPSDELGTTSNRNGSDQGLSVYPNPSRGNFNLALKGDTLKNVEIYSVTGQPVFTQTYADGKANDEIDISSFATGLYIIKAQGADGKQYNAKILKE